MKRTQTAHQLVVTGILVFVGLVSAICNGQTVPLNRAGAPATRGTDSNWTANASVILPNVFRIRIATSDPAEPTRSGFLDPLAERPTADIGEVIGKADTTTLRTQAGALQLKGEQWSLIDATGKTITPFAPPGSVNPTEGNTSTNLFVGWPDKQNFAVYGVGNDGVSLLHKSVHSKVGNGLAVQPFFYSPIGFACFAVSESDDQPMHCDAPIDGRLTWTAHGSRGDLYIILASSLDEAVSTYNTLTGKPPVPPRWAFGYLQSRWGWKDRAYIDDVLKQFTDRKLPVDAFIFDFEWYTKFPDYEVKPAGVKGFSDFEFNAQLFPEPARQIDQLHTAGVKVVGIRKPRLGNADTLAMARTNDWLTHAGPREGFESRNIRFSDPAVRDWYAKQTEPLLRAGIDGWWDDEGELTYSTYRHWNEAQIEALSAVRPDARHWSIDRAFSPGLQRLGVAAWTGDIHADWETLARTPCDLLNWSMSGMTYGACDIGGFNGETNAQLLTRWMQAGVFFPVMRTHSELSVQPHFPWLFGDEAESAIRKALNLRYQLVPMLYSLAHRAYDTGVPIMRPLTAEFPSDAACVAINDQWMIGRMMAAPVLTPDNSRSVYLPPGDWYEFDNNEKLTGGRTLKIEVPFDAIPVFVRAGTILPLGPVVQHTRDVARAGPLEVRIYPGTGATFELVEDDGESTAYLQGHTRRTKFAWDDKARNLSWTISGDYHGNDIFKAARITIVGGNESPHDVSLDKDGSSRE